MCGFFLTRQADRSVSCARDLLICFAAEVHQRRNASTQGWSACVEGHRERLQRKRSPQHAAARTSSKFGSQAELAYCDTLASSPKPAKRWFGATCRLCRERAARTTRQYSSPASKKKKSGCRKLYKPSSGRAQKALPHATQNARSKERKDAGGRLHRLRLADGPGEPVLQDPRVSRVPRSRRRRIWKFICLSRLPRPRCVQKTRGGTGREHVRGRPGLRRDRHRADERPLLLRDALPEPARAGLRHDGVAADP